MSLKIVWSSCSIDDRKDICLGTVDASEREGRDVFAAKTAIILPHYFLHSCKGCASVHLLDDRIIVCLQNGRSV